MAAIEDLLALTSPMDHYHVRAAEHVTSYHGRYFTHLNRSNIH